jgi:taurine dioxygenase
MLARGEKAMKTWTHISVNPIAGALGAEVGGVHLGELGDGALNEVRAAFVEHQVLFFRDQEITRDQHKAFGRRFGTLQVHPYLQPLKDEGHPEFVVLQSDEYAADEALSDKMQRMLSDLVAIHDTTRTFSRTGYRTDHLGGKPSPQVLSAEHPVVRTHPESGRKGLFVNSTFTASIKGMKPRESVALLNFLYTHIETPDFSCRFRWRPNSVAMWDNRCTQHRVVADNRTANRRMERITINGDKPF